MKLRPLTRFCSSALLALGCTGSIETIQPSGDQGGTAGASGGRPPAGAGSAAIAGNGPLAGSGGNGAGSGIGGSSQAGNANGATGNVPTPDGEGNLPYAAPTPGSEALRARTWKLSHA